MSKGKKFNAAEKHFIEKESKYQNQIRSLNMVIKELREDQANLLHNNQVLVNENVQLNEWVERLLKYTELSEADIKAVCEQDKHKDQPIIDFMGMMGLLRNYM